MTGTPDLTCRVCSAQTVPLFEADVLGKYPAVYSRCPTCDFIQTELPTWLGEAYASAINDIDLGTAWRATNNAPKFEAVVNVLFKGARRFLDYGGGYGLFVRIMRDRGLDFRLHDKHCENIFARDYKGELADEHYDLVTAFEVFEHLASPMTEIAEIAASTDAIFFSTLLAPEQIENVSDWVYFGPEHGQHIAFYSTRTLGWIADRLSMSYVTDGVDLHLLSRRRVSPVTFRLLVGEGRGSKLARLAGRQRVKRPSLLWDDFAKVSGYAM